MVSSIGVGLLPTFGNTTDTTAVVNSIEVNADAISVSKNSESLAADVSQMLMPKVSVDISSKRYARARRRRSIQSHVEGVERTVSGGLRQWNDEKRSLQVRVAVEHGGDAQRSGEGHGEMVAPQTRQNHSVDGDGA